MSEVDPKDASDYTLAGLEMTLRPHSLVHSLLDAQTKQSLQQVHVLADRDMIQEALAAGRALLSQAPVSASGWKKKSEVKQRESGKWETLCCGRLSKKASDLYEPRLDVNYLRRADGALSNGAVPPLAVRMLLSIAAPDGTPLYDRIRAEYRVLAPIVTVGVPVTTT